MTDLLPAYLALGTDRAKMSNVIARMKKHFSDESIETYMAVASSGNDIAAGAQMMGLLADRRLIVVTGVDAWKKDDVDPIIDYLKAPSPDAVLLLTADKMPAASRLRKQFTGGALVECGGPEKPADVATWVAKRFGEHGVQVTKPVVTEMVQRAGVEHLDRLITDVELICTYADGDPITVEMVRALTLPNIEHKIWKISDAWASRNKHELLTFVEELVAQGENAVPIVLMLARHLRFVHQARRLIEHMSPSQAQNALASAGANRFAARGYVEQAQRIGMAQADAALARVTQLQAEIQGASNLTGNIGNGRKAETIILERGLVELV